MTNPKWKTCSCCGGPIHPAEERATKYEGIHQRCYEDSTRRGWREEYTSPALPPDGRVIRKRNGLEG